MCIIFSPRRPPSPASPHPYISKAPNEPCAFPPAGENVVPLSADELSNYVKEYNHENRSKLHIWRRTTDEPKADRPKLLRFTIPDVVTVYISIGYDGPNGTILVENMAAFAPREKVGGSGQVQECGGTDEPHGTESPASTIRVYGISNFITAICTRAAFAP